MPLNVLYVLPIEIWILMNHHPPASSIYLSFPLLILHRIWRPLHKKSIGSYLLALSPHPPTFIWSKDHRRDGGIASRRSSRRKVPPESKRCIGEEEAQAQVGYCPSNLFVWCKAKPLVRGMNDEGEKSCKWFCMNTAASFFWRWKISVFLLSVLWGNKNGISSMKVKSSEIFPHKRWL